MERRILIHTYSFKDPDDMISFGDENDLLFLAIHPRVEVLDNILVFYILKKFDFSLYSLSFVRGNAIELHYIPGNFNAVVCIICSKSVTS
jgi:hypothetical protein